MIEHDDLVSLLAYDAQTGVFTWRASGTGIPPSRVAGARTKRQGYRVIRVRGEGYRAHRLAWFYVHKVWPSNQIDHTNGLRDDNRIANLRDVSGHVNQQNRRRAMSTSSTQLMGAYRNGRRFCSRITVDGKLKYLGTFATPEEAHVTYMRAKVAFHEGFVL